MQPKKAKDFVKSLQELNAALSGLLHNIKKDVKMLETSIAANRQSLRRSSLDRQSFRKPYLDKELKGTKLLQSLREHIN